jgi:hypothetical protein
MHMGTHVRPFAHLQKVAAEAALQRHLQVLQPAQLVQPAGPALAAAH